MSDPLDAECLSSGAIAFPGPSCAVRSIIGRELDEMCCTAASGSLAAIRAKGVPRMRVIMSGGMC